MLLHNVLQGTEEWHDLRAKHFTASDCPAMMGQSKYKSRNQLLAEKATGVVPEVSQIKQAIFDKGHKAEAEARQLIEMENLMEFPPVVGSAEIEGLPLLASLDGLAGDVILEHKLWNDTLAENVRTGVLEPNYYWQLEHQLLVFGAESVLFVVSDGTASNRETMIYRSQPDRREKLIAGWKQFQTDLKNYQPEAKKEAVIAAEAAPFPLITYAVEGTDIVSNIGELLPVVKQRAEQEMSRVLETDQDFADKEKLNKAVKDARKKLKEAIANVQGQFVSFSEFSETAKQIDSVLQKMQSHGEKQVKGAKEAKKNAILLNAHSEIDNHIADASKKVEPINITFLPDFPRPDFASAMKNKRTIESLQNAADSVVAETKIAIDQIMAKVVPNQIFLREVANEYRFLFGDLMTIINQDTEPFQAIVKARIAEHKEAEEKRLEAEREKIREEEERKAAEKVKQERKEAEEQIAAAKEAAREEESEKKPAGKAIPLSREKMEKVPELVKDVVLEEPSFAEDMAAWAEKHAISLEATTELSEILKAHGLMVAA